MDHFCESQYHFGRRRRGTITVDVALVDATINIIGFVSVDPGREWSIYPLELGRRRSDSDIIDITTGLQRTLKLNIR
jgi:hypothetical protein